MSAFVGLLHVWNSGLRRWGPRGQVGWLVYSGLAATPYFPLNGPSTEGPQGEARVLLPRSDLMETLFWGSPSWGPPAWGREEGGGCSRPEKTGSPLEPAPPLTSPPSNPGALEGGVLWEGVGPCGPVAQTRAWPTGDWTSSGSQGNGCWAPGGRRPPGRAGPLRPGLPFLTRGVGRHCPCPGAWALHSLS